MKRFYFTTVWKVIARPIFLELSKLKEKIITFSAEKCQLFEIVVCKDMSSQNQSVRNMEMFAIFSSTIFELLNHLPMSSLIKGKK